MSESPVPQSRRKLLKSIALGGGAIAVAKTLPESWTKPVIDSVMLPAHAQTSLSVTDDGTSDDPDGISILFDGSSFTMEAGDDPTNDANLLMFFDVDNDDGLTFDWENANGSNHTNGIGSNWTFVSSTVPEDTDGDASPADGIINDIPEGSYTATFTRVATSTTYKIGFTVAVTVWLDGDFIPHGRMTVSDLSATVV